MNGNLSQNNEFSVSTPTDYTRPSVTTIDVSTEYNISKQEVYQTQLHLKTKIAHICELQNDVKQLIFNSINNLNDHNKRGNSLFAEVDDKRQALTAELEMKNCLSKANHEINQIKMEMMRLENQLLETERNYDLEKSTLIQSYKNRISDLEAKIIELEKRPESPILLKMDNLSNNSMNVVLQIVSDVRKEKKDLEEEMNRRSLRDMEARQQCFKGECENRQLKKEMRRDKLQLKELEQQISVRDMEARQQCFKGECENRQLKKEIRRDKLQLKELEQQISVLKSKLSTSKENIDGDKCIATKRVFFHKNCKIEDGGPSMKVVKKIPQQAVLNTIVCPKFEDS